MKGVVLDCVTVLDKVWGIAVYVKERVVDTNIMVLRRKYKSTTIIFELHFKHT